MLSRFLENRIVFEYATPDIESVNELRLQTRPTRLSQIRGIKELHTYQKQNISGTLDRMLLREGACQRLEQLTKTLPDTYELWIFDAFRTKQTQISLFNSFYDSIQRKNPQLDASEIYNLTTQFVAHPNEAARFSVPPHNSGGAVDLVIAVDGKALDMGTDFDADVPESRTDYFERDYTELSGMSLERWLTIRGNRRLLFNSMRSVGFVNYQPEWWHYDIGDCIWADTLNIDWHYDSMESEI